MDKYENNYHEKFEKLRERKNGFTGNSFNPAEFFNHLQNINFHFEAGKLSRLSDKAIEHIKSKFKFYKYDARIEGLDIENETYVEDLNKLINKYGEKYGFKKGSYK